MADNKKRQLSIRTVLSILSSPLSAMIAAAVASGIVYYVTGNTRLVVIGATTVIGLHMAASGPKWERIILSVIIIIAAVITALSFLPPDMPTISFLSAAGAAVILALVVTEIALPDWRWLPIGLAAAVCTLLLEQPWWSVIAVGVGAGLMAWQLQQLVSVLLGAITGGVLLVTAVGFAVDCLWSWPAVYAGGLVMGAGIAVQLRTLIPCAWLHIHRRSLMCGLMIAGALGHSVLPSSTLLSVPYTFTSEYVITILPSLLICALMGVRTWSAISVTDLASHLTLIGASLFLPMLRPGLALLYPPWLLAVTVTAVAVDGFLCADMIMEAATRLLHHRGSDQETADTATSAVDTQDIGEQEAKARGGEVINNGG